MTRADSAPAEGSRSSLRDCNRSPFHRPSAVKSASDTPPIYLHDLIDISLLTRRETFSTPHLPGGMAPTFQCGRLPWRGDFEKSIRRRQTTKNDEYLDSRCALFPRYSRLPSKRGKKNGGARAEENKKTREMCVREKADWPSPGNRSRCERV